MNWIDIKEQLPELVRGESETILGFFDGEYWTGKIEIDSEDGDIQYNFYEDIDWRIISITHWAKLTPPKTKHLKCPY